MIEWPQSIWSTINPFSKKFKQSPSDVSRLDQTDISKGIITLDELPTSLLPYQRGKQSLNELGLYTASLMVSEYRDTLYSAYQSIRENYLIRSILEVMTDDVLNASAPEDKIISFHSKDKQFEKALNEWKDEMDLDSLISDIIPDILLFGDYILKPTVTGNGIEALEEVYDLNNIIPLYSGNKLEKFIVNIGIEEDPFRKKIEFKEVDDTEYIYFVRSGKRIKVRFSQQFIRDVKNHNKGITDKDFLKLIGQLRIGRSVIPYKLIPTIRSLETLSTILPVMRFMQLDRRTLVGVQVPPAMNPTKVAEMMQDYERVINEATNSTYDSSSGTIDINSLISKLQKFRVVPIQGDKGQLSTQEIPMPEIKDLTDADYLINTIFTGIGFPKEYLMPGVESSNLKQFVRYLKMIASIQFTIQKGIKHAALIHLNAKGMNAVSNDIEVRFETAISIENIDELEYVDILNSLLGNYTTQIQTLSEIEGVPNQAIDWDEVLRFLHSKLKNFRGAEAFLTNYVGSIKNRKPRKIDIELLDKQRDKLDGTNDEEKLTQDPNNTDDGGNSPGEVKQYQNPVPDESDIHKDTEA